MMITAHGAAAAIALVAYAKTTKRHYLSTLRSIAIMFFFGTLPDLPLTVLVISGTFNPLIHYHHKWITHTPFFWMIIALLIMLIFSRRTGLMLLAATWLHLGMDWYGGADGIAFFYPFDSRQFGVALSGVNGPPGFSIYIHQPIFLSLEILIQGTFIVIFLYLFYLQIAKGKKTELQR